MKRLYLLRHAKSSWAENGLRDFDRPLSEKGIKACKDLRSELSKNDILPEKVLSSPAVRTRSTAELVFPETKMKLLPELYLCSTETILNTVLGLKDKWKNVAIVFHNFAITDFVNDIAYTGVNNIKTCGFIEVTINGEWEDIVDRSKLTIRYFNRKSWKSLSS